jgi:2,5-dihydroxypyridine 5,6-dioxygenase
MPRMLADRIEHKWIACFAEQFAKCALAPGETVAILSESQSRALNVQLAELAAQSLGARVFHVVLPTGRNPHPVPIRSTGASEAIGGLAPVVQALASSGLVLDLTVQGLMHARETKAILAGGARILSISNEHPEALERMRPDDALMAEVKAAVKRLRTTKVMHVASPAGTDLSVTMDGATTVGVWGWTDRPGTLAHWPGGIVVSFPAAGTVNGTLVLDRGDINLTFKRYLASAVRLTIEDDYITRIDGEGTDAELMRRYLAAFGDREAYAVSHVGFGLNRAARYEALAMYGQRDTNGTELRAVAGNFLFSTGANEFAGRFTAGHFDIPVMGCDIRLDRDLVIRRGEPTDSFR